jgi:choline dehydrogenase-like flavoprotein
MLNATYAAEAAAAFNRTPASGPYTLALSNSAIWVSLPNISATSSTSITASIRRLAQDSTSRSALYLPSAYGSDTTLIAGYRAQLLHLADLLANAHSPSLESTFATGTQASAILLHPLSRGTVRLNLTHPLELPVADYRSASNPIDIALHLAHTRFLRGMIRTDAVRALGGVEVAPGERYGGDEEGLVAWIRQNTVQSYMHPCCTAAMLPREKGGVVGKDLRVYGVEGLRVVDMSVLPLLVGAHLSATAYAVGEKVSTTT